MDKAASREIEQVYSTLKNYSAFQQYQILDVTFGTANADKDILHTLTPSNPEDIRYIPLKMDRATTIYNDQSGTKKAWKTGLIYLRSSTASAVVRLLLAVER